MCIKLFLYLTVGVWLLPLSIKAQCTMANYTSAYIIPANNYPYFSASTGVTVSATTLNVIPLNNANYSCGGNIFSTASPAWWLNSASSLVTLTFSVPVTNFTVSVNGTNDTEMFTFNSATGSITLSNFCTTGFSLQGTGDQLLYSGASAAGTIISINNPTGSLQYTMSHNGLGSGSRMALLDCFETLMVLPVEIGSFTGEIQSEQEAIELDWQTITESNNDYFQIEQSANGNDFQTIGIEKSKGNSKNIQTYQFIDTNPLFGINYYRLKMVDVDGNYQYSNTIQLAFKSNEIRVFPNPTKGIFEIQGKYATEGTVYVSDYIGRLVLQQNLAISQQIDLTNEPNGTYFIKILSSGPAKVKRIVKQ